MPQVLYRKYRPQNLDEIFGQEHVVATLRNQLASNEVAHAYLFAGPRGTGKTTVARILASELEINEIDLIEVDAASNRGIDDIRSLRESVQFQPAQSPKKLYILDEAHMLTQQAGNALLKTLEEPPAHAHFVLCTTEPQGLPVTILSRCQRFNFELGEKQLLKDYLQDLVGREDLKLELEVLDFIAEKSGGSYRDAAGLLQGVIGLEGQDDLETESVLKRLGYGVRKEVEKLTNLLLQNKTNEAVVELSNLVKKGIEVGVVLETLIEQLRNELVLGKASSDSGIKMSQDDLLKLLRGLHEAQGQIKLATPQQLPIELAILECAAAERPAAAVKDSSKMQEPAGLADKKQEKPYQEPDSKETDNNGSGMTGSVWSQIMQEVRKYNHSLEAILKGSEPQDLEGEVVPLHFGYKFHKEKIEEAGNRRLVEKAISEVLGRKVRIKCKLVQKARNNAESNAEGDQRGSAREKEAQSPARVKDEGGASEDDILKVAQEIFGGEIIE